MKSGERLYCRALVKATVSSVTPSPLAPYHFTLRNVSLEARGVDSYHVLHCGPTRTAGRAGAPDCAETAAEERRRGRAAAARDVQGEGMMIGGNCFLGRAPRGAGRDAEWQISESKKKKKKRV